MINNPIVNDFLEQIVDADDLKNIKTIIQALIDGVETDEAIHEQTDIKLNTVRKLLYKLHDASIANYKRNKDPETQWFTYTWRFEKEEYVEEITKFYTERLNKREAFRKAYDNFDINKVCKYDDTKINELMNNKGIIRNKLKIRASINNALIFKNIVEEYGSFYNYLIMFTKNKIIYETNKTTSKISDSISHDLQKRGMKFVGSTIIYSYLQAIGIVNSHEKMCFKYKNISK